MEKFLFGSASERALLAVFCHFCHVFQCQLGVALVEHALEKLSEICSPLGSRVSLK
jgi:hypothetical protein